jgi:hypothetical protein
VVSRSVHTDVGIFRLVRAYRTQVGLLARLLAAISALLLVITGQAVARSSYTIRTHNGWISRIGPLRTSGSPGPTLGQATEVFGAPSQIDPVGDGADGCHVEWRALRLKTVFADFGGGSACSPNSGALQGATIRSRRFRTVRGVHVGSRSASIPRRHHNAEFKGGAWWIASVYLPYGEGGDVPTIKAIVRRHRVSAIKLYVGAAGD